MKGGKNKPPEESGGLKYSHEKQNPIPFTGKSSAQVNIIQLF